MNLLTVVTPDRVVGWLGELEAGRRQAETDLYAHAEAMSLDGVEWVSRPDTAGVLQRLYSPAAVAARRVAGESHEWLSGAAVDAVLTANLVGRGCDPDTAERASCGAPTDLRLMTLADWRDDARRVRLTLGRDALLRALARCHQTSGSNAPAVAHNAEPLPTITPAKLTEAPQQFIRISLSNTQARIVRALAVAGPETADNLTDLLNRGRSPDEKLSANTVSSAVTTRQTGLRPLGLVAPLNRKDKRYQLTGEGRQWAGPDESQ